MVLHGRRIQVATSMEELIDFCTSHMASKAWPEAQVRAGVEALEKMNLKARTARELSTARACCELLSKRFEAVFPPFQPKILCGRYRQFSVRWPAAMQPGIWTSQGDTVTLWR